MSNYHNLYFKGDTWQNLLAIKDRLSLPSPSATVRVLVQREVKRNERKRMSAERF